MENGNSHQEKNLLLDLKHDFMERIRALNVEQFRREAEKQNETITLYHGTTTARLNSILQNGILLLTLK